MRVGIGLVAAIGAAALLSWSAVAQEKVFHYATTGDILGLDPHNNNEGPTNTMKANIYGRLLHRLPDLSLEPDLAESWERTGDTTWRFKLREGVRFHNGDPFTADDVVYSFKRQSQPSSEMSFALASVKDIRKVDDFAIEIETKGPDPILLLNMPEFYIVDEKYMEANDAFEVVRGAGKTNFANTHANGTGPFKLVEWVQDNRVVLEPNKEWWNQALRKDNLDRAVFTPIANDATRVAALLSGEIDLMYPVPLQDIRRLKADAAVDVLQGPELRTIFLGMDQWRDELLDMPGSGKNPFKDLRVRGRVRARDRPGGDQARGHARRLDADRADDRAGRQRLPGGHEPALRLRSGAVEAAARGRGLSRRLPGHLRLPERPLRQRRGDLHRDRADARADRHRRHPERPDQIAHFNKIGGATGNNTSFYMLGWTPGSYDAYNVLQNIMTMDGEGQGTWNCGRYSNPKVEALTDRSRSRSIRTSATRRSARRSRSTRTTSATSRCTSRRWPGACAPTRWHR